MLKPAGTFPDLKHLQGKKNTNIALDYHLQRGDAEAAFKKADRVFELVRGQALSPEASELMRTDPVHIDGPLRSDYAGYGGDIASAARHLLSVIRSMSEDPTEGQRTIDLAALAAEAVVMLEASAEERQVAIELEAKEPLPASGEERAVIQILVNLIGNAVRHSPERGAVTLTFVRTSAAASVTVSDQGPGIEPADQQRIFERFERAGTKSGTGLGLAISRRLARLIGGDLAVSSDVGRGSEFTVWLPIDAIEPEQTAG